MRLLSHFYPKMNISKNKSIFALVAILCLCSFKKESLIAQTTTATLRTLHFLDSISGLRTVAGIHNREPNAAPATWTDSIHSTTGKYPGLWSGDFLFEQDNIDNRQTMINEAIHQWKQGALVNIMWHACNPAWASLVDLMDKEC